jgi:uncharacterized protein
MMSTLSGLRISVADVLRRPGASRQITLREPVAGLGTPAVGAGEPVLVSVTIERVADGVVVRGTVEAEWHAECSRCLAPVQGTATVHVDELYEPHPLDGETYLLEGEEIDLEPVVRDSLLPELPAVPLCRAECAGLCPQCGADRNTTRCDCTVDDTDPRWAALRSLEL